MKLKITPKWSPLALALGAALSLLPLPTLAAPLPPTDNTSAPYMGIYCGSPYDAANRTKISFAGSWLNRSDNLWAVEFLPWSSWTDIQGPNWALDSGKNWLNGNPTQRKYILTVPMLPGYINSDGYGVPATGTSLALGAAGNHTSNFVTLATRLGSRTLSNGVPMASRTIIRLGHEFNGKWYPWRALTSTEAANFAEYFRKIVTAMRAAPGCSDLEFCWNGVPLWNSYGLATAYPGNDYVDTIGVDVYDQSWGYMPDGTTRTYPYPAGATQSVMLAHQTRVWTNELSVNWNNGLAVWKSFATARGVPLSIPEWGVMKRTDGHGGLDNAYFIQKMFNFIHEPANNVQWHAYFDHSNSEANSRLVAHPGYTTIFPEASALFQQLFSVQSLFADDFTDGNSTGWTGTPSARWSVAADAGDNAYKYDFDWNNQTGKSTAGSASWTNVTINADFKVTDMQSYSETRFFFRHASATDHYCLDVRENGGSKKLVLTKVVNGAAPVDLAQYYTAINPNTWYTLTITANGSSLNVKINGAQAIQVTDTVHTAGGIGIGCWKQDVLFDNVTVGP